MNFLGRLLLGKPEREPGRCPKCQAVECARIVQLVGWSIAAGEHIERVIGSRYSCQRCGHQYSVGPSGVFEHHALALPPSPKWSQPPAPAPPAEPRVPIGPMRDEPLVPRPRPS